MPDVYRTVLIVEGGAMRSVFSAGLLDGFLQQQFDPFDAYIGVSAGAGNLITYMCAMPEKSLQIYNNFALRTEFINYLRFMRGGHLIDLDWLTQKAFSGLQFDLETVYRRNKPLYIGVTDVTSGAPVYINTTQTNLEKVIKASMALPVFYRRFPEIGGRPMTDGGVAEGIPVAEAMRMGARRIMVVRSRHKAYMKKDTLAHKLIRMKMKKYPNLLNTMRNRLRIHANSIALIRNPPTDVSIVEICPPESISIGRFSRDPKSIMQAYQYGLGAAGNAIAQWQSGSEQ